MLHMTSVDSEQRDDGVRAAVEPEARVRRILALGLIGALLGLAIAGTVDRTAGGVLGTIGWLALAYGVHKLGRLES